MNRTILKLFGCICLTIMWFTISTYAAGLPDLLEPGTRWEYSGLNTSEGGVTTTTNSYHRVEVVRRTESNDTVFITTAEPLLVVTSQPIFVSSGPSFDSILSRLDTSWNYTYAIVAANNNSSLGYTIIQLNVNYHIAAGKTISVSGFLPNIFPGMYYSDSSKFSLILDGAAYSFLNVGGVVLYHKTIGRIYTSQYYFTAGGGSMWRILSYNDSIINVNELYNKLDSLQTPVTRLRSKPHPVHQASSIDIKHDLLGRKISLNVRNPSVLPIITSSEMRILLQIRQSPPAF